MFFDCRDNCCSSITKNGQRQFETWKLPSNKELGHAAKLQTSDDTLHVAWEMDGSNTSSHVSEFGSDWLKDHQYDSPNQPAADTTEVYWDATSIQERATKFNHGDVTKGGSALLPMLQAFKKYGFVVVKGCPTESGTVVEFGNNIGFVRRTNYGNMFNVQNLPDGGNNMAYTSLGLSVHTDNPYRDPTPGAQPVYSIPPQVRNQYIVYSTTPGIVPIYSIPPQV
jgi:gamma-butyrobetaine dioxygenase